MQLTLIVDFRNQFISYGAVGHLDLCIGNIRLCRWAPGSGRHGAHLLVAFQNEGMLRRFVALDIQHRKAISRALFLLFEQRRAAVEEGLFKVHQPPQPQLKGAAGASDTHDFFGGHEINIGLQEARLNPRKLQRMRANGFDQVVAPELKELVP